MIAILSKDLFFVPTLRSAASRHNCVARLFSSFDEQSLAQLAAEPVAAFVIDLNSCKLDELTHLYGLLDRLVPDAAKCAFGSHVHKQRLDAARTAGFQPVLTRGQVETQIGELMGLWRQKVEG